MPTIERDDSVLVVVDAQPGFVGERAGDAGDDRAVVARIAWLAGVAAALEESGRPSPRRTPSRTGPPIPRHPTPCRPGRRGLRQAVFGLAAVPAILAAIGHPAAGRPCSPASRRTLCVAQSALGLLDLGYRVAVVVDATGSPGEMHEHGLRRMRDVGAIAVHGDGRLRRVGPVARGGTRVPGRAPRPDGPPGLLPDPPTYPTTGSTSRHGRGQWDLPATSTRPTSSSSARASRAPASRSTSPRGARA